MTHEELIDAPGGLAAFADGPDDEALSAANVAGGKDAGDAGGVVFVAGDIAAGIELEPKLADGAVVLGVDEAEGEQAQIAIKLEFASRGLLSSTAGRCGLWPTPGGCPGVF